MRDFEFCMHLPRLKGLIDLCYLAVCGYRQLSRLAESIDPMKVLSFVTVGKSHIGSTVQNKPVVIQDLPLLIA